MIIILYMINHSGKTNNFATLFDGNNLNDWQMAGQGKFVIVKEEGNFTIRRRYGTFMVYQENIS